MRPLSSPGVRTGLLNGKVFVPARRRGVGAACGRLALSMPLHLKVTVGPVFVHAVMRADPPEFAGPGMPTTKLI